MSVCPRCASHVYGKGGCRVCLDDELPVRRVAPLTAKEREENYKWYRENYEALKEQARAELAAFR